VHLKHVIRHRGRVTFDQHALGNEFHCEQPYKTTINEFDEQTHPTTAFKIEIQTRLIPI
jgi:hypothetical protein